MKWSVIVALVAVGLAGCADESKPVDETPDDTNFDDVQVTVSDTTGAILGVVVNDAIVPVGGADVVLLNTEHATTTDEQGRFTFSNIEAGTYFLEVSKPFHDPVQSSVNVEAGVEKPDFVKVQLNRLFQGEPYMVTIPNDGFFTCTQDGAVVWGYSSSPCHSFCVWTFVAGCAATHDGCEDGTVCLDQMRDFHADVGEGWQTQIFEMKWEPSASGTSAGMGMVVSTYKPERQGSHWFAEFEKIGSPLYGRLDCAPDDNGDCTEGPSASGVEPVAIPQEGIQDMSYFVSVRGEGDAPGFAIDQDFEVWLTQFYYQPAPEDWSFIGGSPSPF